MVRRGSAARKLDVAPPQRSSPRFSSAAAAKASNDNLLIVRNAIRLFHAEGVVLTHFSLEGGKLIVGLDNTDRSPSFNNDVPSSAKANDKTDINGYRKNLKSAESPRPRQEPPAMKPITMG